VDLLHEAPALNVKAGAHPLAALALAGPGGLAGRIVPT
jgi:hypothetical protein